MAKNPRDSRTVRDIREAFFTALEQKDFCKLSVQDILDISKVNRSTFYRYYYDKYDLYNDIVKKYADQCRELLLTGYADRPTKMMLNHQRVAEFIMEHRRELRLLWHLRISDVCIQEELSQIILDNLYNPFLSYIKQREPSKEKLSPFEEELLVTQYIALFRCVLFHDVHLDPADIPCDTENLFRWSTERMIAWQRETALRKTEPSAT